MLITFFLTVFLIFICAAIHYEALFRFETMCRYLKIKGRIKVFAGIVWALLAHTIETWCFALGYFLLVNQTKINSLVDPNGEAYTNLLDMVYFSFISYTSLGYGDLVPAGPVRFLAGSESLVGLVFIAWTASFLYLEMQKNWIASK